MAQEVFSAAADPKVFPEMGLEPWAPLKVYARVPNARVTKDGIFDYATEQYVPVRFFNYVEKKVTNPVTGAKTPQYVKFNQNSGFNHTEEFAELELRPLPGLTITPGFKHVDFNLDVTAFQDRRVREAMLRAILTQREGSPISVTLLSSDMGKLYVALAQAIERLRT